MDATPLFTTDYSIADSTITTSKDIFAKVIQKEGDRETVRETKDIHIKYPVSAFAIAKKHGIDPLIFVELSMSGFWHLYKTAKELETNFVFGLKIRVCDDLKDKSDESVLTESNVIIFVKNSDGYLDLCRLFSKGSIDGFHRFPRLDWAHLNEMWTPNLELCIPFYSSFLARNLLKFKSCAVPNFKSIKTVTFFKERHDLPFDGLLHKTLEGYLKNHPQYDSMDTHSIYYYQDEDFKPYQTLKCFNNRSTIAKPNLNHFGSDKFSFQNFLKTKNDK